MDQSNEQLMKLLGYLSGIIIVLLILGLIWLKATVTPSLTRQELAEFEYETLKLSDGMSVNYRIDGKHDGPTLLLIHGGGDSIDDWNAWLPALKPEFHIVSVDLPGHGLTDPLPEENYGPVRFAVFVKDFVQAMELKDFTIVSHSFGGDTVVRYMLENPDQPDAMILIASGGFHPPDNKISDTEKEILAYGNTWWGRLIFPYLNKRSDTKEGLESYFYNKSANTEIYTDKIFHLSLYEKNRGVMLKLLSYSLSTYEDVTGLENIKVPTLILWGDKDNIALPEFAERFHASIPNSSLKMYSNIGHMLMMESPAESIQDVISFLKSVYR